METVETMSTLSPGDEVTVKHHYGHTDTERVMYVTETWNMPSYKGGVMVKVSGLSHGVGIGLIDKTGGNIFDKSRFMDIVYLIDGCYHVVMAVKVSEKQYIMQHCTRSGMALGLKITESKGFVSVSIDSLPKYLLTNQSFKKEGFYFKWAYVHKIEGLNHG